MSKLSAAKANPLFSPLVFGATLGVLGGALSAPALAAPAAASAGVPAVKSDVQRLDKLLTSYGNGLDKAFDLDNLQAALVAETLAVIDLIAEENLHPASMRSTNPKLVVVVEQLVRGATAPDNGKSSLSAKKARTAIWASFGGTLAEQALALFHGLDAPSFVPGSGRELGASASVMPGKGPLQISVAESSVRGDRGSYGGGNGVLDPGEAADLVVTYRNASSARVYSSSVYASDQSGCLYVEQPQDLEHELGEMNAGQVSSAVVSVYVSRECGGRSAALALRVHDSAALPDGSTSLLNLRIPARRGARLQGVTIDGDDYGHSEPLGSRVALGSAFEVSAGVVVEGAGLDGGYQWYVAPSVLGAKHSPSRLVFRQAGGELAAGPADDLDVTFADTPANVAYLTQLASQHGWKSPEDARLMIAVDSVAYDRAAPAGATGSKSSSAKGRTRAAVESPAPEEAQKGALLELVGSRIAGGAPAQGEGSSQGAADSMGLLEPALSGAVHYQWRHYVSVPVEWSGPTQCSLSANRMRIRLGESVFLAGTVENAPAGSEVKLYLGGDRYDISLAADGSFRGPITPSRSGTLTGTLTVSSNGAVRCIAEVEGLKVEPPVDSSSPIVAESAGTDFEEEKTAQKSLEFGVAYNASAGLTSGEATFTVGGVPRFLARAAVGEDAYAAIGVRFVGFGNDPGAVFQPWAELALRLGAVVKPSAGVGLSVHGAVGPFVSASGVVAPTGVEGIVSGGIGFYWPREKK